MALTTKLEAINRLLASIGEAPVNTIEEAEAAQGADVSLAIRILDETSKSVQERGWHFNTNRAIVVTPDTETNEINLPADTIRVDTIYQDLGHNVCQRGLRLYSIKANSFTEWDQPSYKVDIVAELPFEQIPEAASLHIIAKAGRRFQEQSVSSNVLEQYTRQEEMETYARLNQMDGETEDNNYIYDSGLSSYIATRDRRGY